MAQQVTPPPSATAVAAQVAPTPTAPGSSNAASGDINATIGSMNDLKAQAPAVYNAMMQGIGWNICEDMADQEQQREQLQAQYEQQA